MKKTVLATALILATGAASAATTHTMDNGRFDFKGADGVVTADGHNDVQGTFDMANGTGAFTTSTNFVGYTWSADVVEMGMHNTMMGGTDVAAVEAHSFDFNVREFFTFSSGSVSCLSVASAGYDGCAQYAGDIAFEGVVGGTDMSYNYNLTAGQFAAHTLFDWSSTADIPVLAIMQVTNNPQVDGFMTVASVDLNGNVSGGGALYGVAMADCVAMGGPACGPFPNQTPIFSGTINPVSAVPVPAAVWLFGSGLVGLAGIARRRKTA